MTFYATIRLCPLDVSNGLNRLEQSLGLARPRLPAVDRLFRYAMACETAGVTGWTKSLEIDRFGTAMHLLRRREDALMAGWDGIARQTPALADLAAVEKILASGPGRDLDTEADRLRRILASLARGLRVTVPIEIAPSPAWSPLWRQVATAIGAVEQSHLVDPAGRKMLRVFQDSLAGTSRAITPDGTLAAALVGGSQAAAQALAALLAEATPERRADTVVVCDDARLLAALDDRLARAGLPRLGSPAVGASTALDGLLPLAVALCWDPVDPTLLLEYCLLPDGPLGRKTGNRLAAALAQFPGLGSCSWEDAIQELTTKENDPDGKIAERLGRWFTNRRLAAGESAPAELLAERCRMVAAWAGARAGTAEVAGPLLMLAGGASRLAEIFAATGGLVTAPAAARLLVDALAGTATGRHLAEAGAPLLVAQPWRIPDGCRHVIWIAPTAVVTSASAWTAKEWSALRAVGLTVDDGQGIAAARREGDRLGLSRIIDDLLVVELPPSADRRCHPAALTLHLGLLAAKIERDQRPRLDDPAQQELLLAGWKRRCAVVKTSAPQPQRVLWVGPPGGLRDRETHSYSELERRLACPLAWTLNYAAKLRAGGSASLPADHQLQGTFAHAVLEDVFAHGIPKPDAAATEAGRIFDERIVRDAVPLALPNRQADRRKLRDRVVETARVLAETLDRAGCTNVEMEAAISSELGGRQFAGNIDCLATGRNLAVIVDLKLGSLDKHRDALVSGRAIQLAIYAATRKERTVAVGYAIINGRRILTPEGAAIPKADNHGCEILVGAPGWSDTWTDFSKALDADDGWMKDEPIPARPLGDPASWPLGAELVLKANEDEQNCCTYCDYGVLCGREERN